MNVQKLQQLSRDAHRFKASLNDLERGIKQQEKQIALINVELDFHSRNLSEVTGNYQPDMSIERWLYGSLPVVNDEIWI
jgi:hypothetical protein